jgi:hypothetical protein
MTDVGNISWTWQFHRRQDAIELKNGWGHVLGAYPILARVSLVRSVVLAQSRSNRNLSTVVTLYCTRSEEGFDLLFHYFQRFIVYEKT